MQPGPSTSYMRALDGEASCSQVASWVGGSDEILYYVIFHWVVRPKYNYSSIVEFIGLIASLTSHMPLFLSKLGLYDQPMRYNCFEIINGFLI